MLYIDVHVDELEVVKQECPLTDVSVKGLDFLNGKSSILNVSKKNKAVNNEFTAFEKKFSEAIAFEIKTLGTVLKKKALCFELTFDFGTYIDGKFICFIYFRILVCSLTYINM